MLKSHWKMVCSDLVLASQRSLDERSWIRRCRLEIDDIAQQSAVSSQQSAVSSQQSALNGGDRNFEAMNGEAATRCFLVTAIHVFSCFPDGIDHLIERDHELTISG